MTAPDAPLTGQRVLVSRAPDQARALSERIAALGGDPVEAPVLHIEAGDDEALRAAVRDLAAGRYVAVCLTSPNGVHALADATEAVGADETACAGDTPAWFLGGVATIACVGPGTAAALQRRLRVVPDLVPPRATTRSLGEAFPPGSGRVLLPRANIASPVLRELLTERGYEPVEVAAYRTTAPEALPDDVVDDLAAGRIDLLAFASSSTVRNFAALVGDRPWAGRVVSIGPVTSETCREFGIEVAAEADPHDLDGLVAALIRAAADRAAG